MSKEQEWSIQTNGVSHRCMGYTHKLWWATYCYNCGQHLPDKYKKLRKLLKFMEKV